MKKNKAKVYQAIIYSPFGRIVPALCREFTSFGECLSYKREMQGFVSGN